MFLHGSCGRPPFFFFVSFAAAQSIARVFRVAVSLRDSAAALAATLRFLKLRTGADGGAALAAGARNSGKHNTRRQNIVQPNQLSWSHLES